MRTLLLVALCIVISAIALYAELPVSDPGNTITTVSHVMTYQGILKDNAGDPVPDATYNITFKIYDDPAAGNLLWTGPAIPVTTKDGYFTTEFEPVGLAFDIPYYLSLQVGADPEMAARQKMTTAPYAIIADTTDVTSCWYHSNNVVYTGGEWGVAKGSANNTLHGDLAKTHVNLGGGGTTGTAGQNYEYCTIGGGANNTASARLSTVSGGMINIAMGDGATIGGGSTNAAIGHYSTIGGGQQNSAGDSAVVSGGASNEASGSNAAIGGGLDNTASGPNAVVGGGYNNSASRANAIVGGGIGNAASGVVSTVAGGYFNTASGNFSSIGGGQYNWSRGIFSNIPGGNYDTLWINANYSMAFGTGIYCDDDYRVVFFDSLNDGSLNINRDGRDGTINTYPIHVGGQTDDGNGAYLTAGGTWTNGSSRTFKENFTPFDGEELLSKISGLSITSYNYINSSEKHIGPVAEEFVGTFDTGVIRESDGKRDDKYLAASDVAGVALAGVQELLKIIEQQNAKIETLQDQINELNSR